MVVGQILEMGDFSFGPQIGIGRFGFSVAGPLGSPSGFALFKARSPTGKDGKANQARIICGSRFNQRVKANQEHQEDIVPGKWQPTPVKELSRRFSCTVFSFGPTFKLVEPQNGFGPRSGRCFSQHGFLFKG